MLKNILNSEIVRNIRLTRLVRERAEMTARGIPTAVEDAQIKAMENGLRRP